MGHTMHMDISIRELFIAAAIAGAWVAVPLDAGGAIGGSGVAGLLEMPTVR